mmetsp:Transcript_10686/g.28574  ORF Transcript_10686/g.28574 Transcript_10686/m.28574 type:complete len:245 (+) Transcript_10686:450-1184(+)
MEMRSKHVVHHQLTTEARGVLEDHEKDPEVHQTLDILHGARPLGLPQDAHVELSCCGVLRASENPQRQENVQGGWHEHGSPPRGRHRQTQTLIEEPVDQRHEHLGEATAQVAPTPCSRVGSAHDGFVEHDRIPELVHHKGGAETRHEEACGDQARRAGDRRTGRNHQCSKTEQHAISVPRPEPLDHAPHDKASEDVERDSSDVGGPDLRLARLLAHARIDSFALGQRLDVGVIVAEPDVHTHHG